ncbi:MAG: hypothetical protein VX026_00500 [Myxococcota bacterium]|nr:hypothetical protein [Myxococcota bacterium]
MSKTQQTLKSTVDEQSTESNQATSLESNAAKAQQLRSQNGTAEGLNNYQQALGGWLGSELYGAIAPHLSHDAIGSYAEQGLGSLIDQLEAYVRGLDGNVEPDVFDSIFAQIDKDVDGLAEQFIQNEGAGLVNALGSWVDAHPRVIVSVAILAAIGAYLADMDIPTLSQKFNISDGLTAKFGANIGSLQNIALEKISAKLEYKSGILVAAVQVDRTKDGNLTGTVSGALGETGRKVEGNVVVDGSGLKAYAATGELNIDNQNKLKAGLSGGRETEGTNVTVSVERNDGTVKQLNNVNYNSSTGVISANDSKEMDWLGGVYTSKVDYTGKEGSSTQNWKGNITDNTALDATLTESNSGRSLQTVGTYTNNDFKAELDAKYGDQTGSSIDGSVQNRLSDDFLSHFSMGINSDGLYTYGSSLDYDNQKGLNASLGMTGNNQGALSANGSIDYTTNNHNLGGSVDYDISQSQLSELRAYYAFKDDKSFNAFMAEYRYNLDPVAQHNFDLTIQRELFDMRWRLNEKIGYSSENGLSTNTSLLGAKALNDRMSVIGGVRHEYSAGEHNVLPQVGVQYNEIPIVIEYDPKNNGASVRLELKF